MLGAARAAKEILALVPEAGCEIQRPRAGVEVVDRQHDLAGAGKARADVVAQLRERRIRVGDDRVARVRTEAGEEEVARVEPADGGAATESATPAS